VRSRRMQRLQGLQRLRSRRLQGLQSLRGLRRVQLRLLHFVGRLPVHLLGANSSRLCPTQRVHQKIIASITAALPVCMRTGRVAVGGCRACGGCSFPMRSIEDSSPNAGTTLRGPLELEAWQCMLCCQARVETFA